MLHGVLQQYADKVCQQYLPHPGPDARFRSGIGGSIENARTVVRLLVGNDWTAGVPPCSIQEKFLNICGRGVHCKAQGANALPTRHS